jgi:hypothetical protein
MPPRILAYEAATVSLEVIATFYARLSFRDGHVLKPGIVNAEQWAFSSE